MSNFGGFVSVEAGTLALTSSASIVGASSFDIQPGAILALEVFSPGDLNILGISGNFAAAGTLRVTLAPGASPQAGDTYDLLDFASLTGTFDAVELPILAAGLQWNTISLLTTGVLSIEGEELAG